MLFLALTKVLRKLDYKNIFILRHAETDFNKRGIVQGSGIDAPLNDTGKAQAHAFYTRYKDYPFDKIYISALQRTHQSVKEFIDDGIPYEKLKGLNEIDWGVFEGKEITPSDNEYYNILIENWKKGKVDYRIDGGESPLMVQKRLQHDMEIILSRPDEKNVLICMHGRAMRILLTTLLNYPLSSMDRFAHQNMGFYHLTYDENTFTLVMANDAVHVG